MTLTRHTRLTLPSAVAAAALFCWASITDAQQIASYFSPRGGALPAVLVELDAAKTSIDVAAFQLSHPRLAAALAAAQARGITVRVVVDSTQEGSNATQPDALRRHQVQIRTDRVEKLQHNKYAVIDGTTTITGSYNWSENAESRNAENLLIIKDPATAAAFAADFNKHWQHSQAYRQRDPAQPKRTIPQPVYLSPNHRPRH